MRYILFEYIRINSFFAASARLWRKRWSSLRAISSAALHPMARHEPQCPRGWGLHQFGSRMANVNWSYGLLDCFSDCGTCCLAYFCPCVVFQQVKQRINYLSSNGRPDPEQGGSGCGGDCCLYGTVQACVGLVCLFRVKHHHRCIRLSLTTGFFRPDWHPFLYSCSLQNQGQWDSH